MIAPRESITVRPDRLRQFGDGAGSVFCLVTNTDLAAAMRIETSGDYEDYLTVTLDPGDSFEAQILEHTPLRTHILVISPNRFFESPPRALLGERKLVAMACNSTPTSLDTIAHFLGVMERTDPRLQEAFAERFFALVEASESLEIVDDSYGTRATLEHGEDVYEWNQQAGFIEWGEQQIAPSGELSVLPASLSEFDPGLRLALDGEISLRGYPIVHSGLVYFTREDQARLYAELATLADHAVVATVQRGLILGIKPTHPAAARAATMLEAMFGADSRYQIVWEIGIGINTELDLAPGNTAMNEAFGGRGGVFHLGVGLTPFTQYALIVICPTTRVLAVQGQELISGLNPSCQTRRINVRRDGMGCGCRV